MAASAYRRLLQCARRNMSDVAKLRMSLPEQHQHRLKLRADPAVQEQAFFNQRECCVPHVAVRSVLAALCQPSLCSALAAS